MEYAFGDSEMAATRLKVLAEVFAPSSTAFLRDAMTGPPQSALDLGCGPGYSTHLVAEVLECGHTMGLDNSEAFISLARGTGNERVSFRVHDLTTAPPPMPPCDLIYCRFLLTHVREPEAVVAAWARQLRPSGLFLIDEVEAIDVGHPVFAGYLAIVEAMLRHQSNELYIGPSLDRLSDSDALRPRASDVRRLPVSNRDAARMFSLNIQCWKHQPFVRDNCSTAEIERLEADLKAIAERPDDRVEIEWALRQVALERG
jgi:ubiquinone/menaquinone biosynthesis C-methylase UbiE